ncbi:ABC transporter substrate-binding protein [Williamsia sp. CHRR-6]|nr:ABC transporter substrate-binding protein [Williamsia sp. CHRR-6]
MLSACGDSQSPPGEGTVITTTTKIGPANLVAPERNFDRACGAPSVADPGRPDVDRIAVTDPALLDPICALGIAPRVVAVAAATGSIARNLGRAVTSLPTIGVSPTPAAARAARAQVVLGYDAARTAVFGGRSVIIDRRARWQDQFQAVADALGRGDEGKKRLATFAELARTTGLRIDAAHSQVGLVRFGENDETIEGTGSFAGSILAAVGVQRPASQRQPGPVAVTEGNFTDADADLIYVSFRSAAAQKHGVSVMKSDRWRDMGAPSWNRVLVVDDDIWYGTGGLAAAAVVLGDIGTSLNSFSTS